MVRYLWKVVLSCAPLFLSVGLLTAQTSNCCVDHVGTGCDNAACETAVCDYDPSCCEIEWDQTCAFLASDLFCSDLCQAGGPECGDGVVNQDVEACDGDDLAGMTCEDLDTDTPAGSNCYNARAETGCDDAACQEVVCEIDEYCCEEDWDEICAGEALELCVDYVGGGLACDGSCQLDTSGCLTGVVVAIDIKFCSNPNALNCKKKGVIPITIFGSSDLNVLDIDVATLQLCLADDAGVCTTVPPVDYSVMDRGDPTVDLGASECAVIELVEQDYLTLDGHDDLDVVFDAQDIVETLFEGCEFLEKKDITPTVVLYGATVGGVPFSSTPTGNVGIDQFLKQN